MSKVLTGAEITGARRSSLPTAEAPVGEFGSVAHWQDVYTERRELSSGRVAWELMVPVTCGVCGKRRPVRVSRALGGGYSGLCRGRCDGKRRIDPMRPRSRFRERPGRLVSKYAGRVQLADPDSFCDYDDKDPENPKKRGVVCGGCFRDGRAAGLSLEEAELAAKHYVTPQPSDPEWSGLCRTHANPRRRTGLFDLDSGGLIDFDDKNPENPKQVAVYCVRCIAEGLAAEEAKHYASVQKRRGRLKVEYLGYCQHHKTLGVRKRAGRTSLDRFGSFIDWDAPDPESGLRFKVYCGACLAVAAARGDAEAVCWRYDYGIRSKNKPKLVGICKRHRSAEGVEEWSHAVGPVVVVASEQSPREHQSEGREHGGAGKEGVGRRALGAKKALAPVNAALRVLLRTHSPSQITGGMIAAWTQENRIGGRKNQGLTRQGVEKKIKTYGSPKSVKGYATNFKEMQKLQR